MTFEEIKKKYPLKGQTDAGDASASAGGRMSWNQIEAKYPLKNSAPAQAELGNPAQINPNVLGGMDVLNAQSGKVRVPAAVEAAAGASLKRQGLDEQYGDWLDKQYDENKGLAGGYIEARQGRDNARTSWLGVPVNPPETPGQGLGGKETEEAARKMKLATLMTDEQLEDLYQRKAPSNLDLAGHAAGRVLEGAADALIGTPQFLASGAAQLMSVPGALIDSTVSAATGGKYSPGLEDRMNRVAASIYDDASPQERFKNWLHEYVEAPVKDKHLSKGQQRTGALAENVGAMSVPIALGKLTKLLGGSEKAAGIINRIAFGSGAASGAVKTALNEGADFGTAYVYGLASGLKEVITEEMFAGVQGMNKSGIIDNIITGLKKNGVMRMLVNTFGEGVEEVVAEVIEPFLKRATYDRDAALADLGDLLDAGESGMLLSLIMNALGVATSGSLDALTATEEGMTEAETLRDDKSGRTDYGLIEDTLKGYAVRGREAQSTAGEAETRTDEARTDEAAEPQASDEHSAEAAPSANVQAEAQPETLSEVSANAESTGNTEAAGQRRAETKAAQRAENLSDTGTLNAAYQDPSRWQAQKAEGNDAAPRTITEIFQRVNHEFGVNVTTGHIRARNVLGQYNTVNRGIRVKDANNLPTLCHELGHAIDRRYGLIDAVTDRLPVTRELNMSVQTYGKRVRGKLALMEGFAEYLRKYMANAEEATQKFPNTTRWLFEQLSPREAALIRQTAREVNAYYATPADLRDVPVRSKDEASKDFRPRSERAQDAGDKFYQDWVDKYHSIKRVSQAAGNNAPYVLAQNSARGDAIAAQIITGRVLTDPYGRDLGDSLSEALRDINTRNRQEYADFNRYLVFRHGLEYLAEGMDVFADPLLNNREYMERNIAKLEAAYPKFHESAEKLYNFIWNFNSAWAVQTGLISRETLEAWRKKRPCYVPFNRAVYDGKNAVKGARKGFANQRNPYRRARGGGQDIVNPVENLMDNIIKIVNSGLRNNVMRSITLLAKNGNVDAQFLEQDITPLARTQVKGEAVKNAVRKTLDNMGDDAGETDADFEDAIMEFLDDVFENGVYQYGTGKAKQGTVTVMDQGKPTYWKINDPLLFKSLTELGVDKAGAVLNAYAASTRFITSVLTGSNPIWSLASNAPRDLMTFGLYFKNHKDLPKAFANLFSAYGQAFRAKTGLKLDPIYREYLGLGGGHDSYNSADRKYTKRALQKMTPGHGLANVLDKLNLVSWVSFISDTIELGPRYATYKTLRESGLNPQQAFYEAQDITVNFYRGGSISRQVNKAVPFFNASVQGIDKFGRYFTAEDVDGKSRKKVAFQRGAFFVAASAILAGLEIYLNCYRDDDRENYRRLSNYTKNSYWCIPRGDGTYITIPKPRELTVLESGITRMFEAAFCDNKHAFDEFLSYTADNAAPPIISDLISLPENVAKNGLQEGLLNDTLGGMLGSTGLIGTVAYEVANRDFLGRPIVSQSMLKLPAAQQYSRQTSALAYHLGQALGLSPLRIDYAGKNLLGVFWKLNTSLLPKEASARDLTLGTKSTYVRDVLYSNDIVNRLFDKAAKSETAHNGEPKDAEKGIANALDSRMTGFYSRFNRLNRDNKNAEEQRRNRELIIEMLDEYVELDGKTPKGMQIILDAVKHSSNGDVPYNTELLPSVMDTFITNGGQTYELNDTQYYELQTKANNYYYAYVEQNVKPGMSQDERTVTIKKAKEVARARARDDLLKEFGARSEYFDKFRGVNDSDLITFKAWMASENDKDSVTQAEVIEQLWAMVDAGLDGADADTLFRSKYKSDANNPFVRFRK